MRESESNNSLLYYETIIETGFNIYFLISSYMEIDIHEMDNGTNFFSY